MAKLTDEQRDTLMRLEAIVKRGQRPGAYGRGALTALRRTLESGRRDDDQDADLERVKAVMREAS